MSAVSAVRFVTRVLASFVLTVLVVVLVNVAVPPEWWPHLKNIAGELVATLAMFALWIAFTFGLMGDE